MFEHYHYDLANMAYFNQTEISNCVALRTDQLSTHTDDVLINESKQMDRENEEAEEEERQSIVSSEFSCELNEELETGYKILCDLMADSKKAVNWPFMESIEVTAPDLYNEIYKKKIQRPVWLKLMKQKFEEHQYGSITEFVSDFRLMLENCYRFNGPDHYISKRGQKMETMLQQKLALLPRDLREKTAISATSGQKADNVNFGLGLRRRSKAPLPHDSTNLLNQLREAELQKVREFRRQQILDRRAEKEALAQEILEWEDNVLFGGKYKQHMKSMWEIPQIGLFLFLCQGPLNIGEVMHFELERCFMMPRESSTMQLVMTSLLSTPFQRLKLDKKNLMPYKVWDQKLRCKLQAWYKIYNDSSDNVEATCNKLGLEEKFFSIVGEKNPMERRKYHELYLYQKVWIMKSLCDNCMHMQDSLRETIEAQPCEDQREYMLGTDADGHRYIHFPQFCGADVRIYKQASFQYPQIEIKPDPFDNKRKFPFVYKPPPKKKVKMKTKSHAKVVEKPSILVSTVRTRPSWLRQAPKNVVPLQLLDETLVMEGTSSTSSESEEETEVPSSSGVLVVETSEKTDNDHKLDDLSVVASVSGYQNNNEETDSNDGDRQSTRSDATIAYGESSDSMSEISSQDCSRESSPYPSYPDQRVWSSSQRDRASDISQESSPCPSPADYRFRHITRLDRFCDNAQDASPLMVDSDFDGSRNVTKLKNIPPLRASRNLSKFLMDENSASNSSLGMDIGISGQCSVNLSSENSQSLDYYNVTSRWAAGLDSKDCSKSSETGEESNGCDISDIFTNSKTDKEHDRSAENVGLTLFNNESGNCLISSLDMICTSQGYSITVPVTATSLSEYSTGCAMKSESWSFKSHALTKNGAEFGQTSGNSIDISEHLANKSKNNGNGNLPLDENSNKSSHERSHDLTTIDDKYHSSYVAQMYSLGNDVDCDVNGAGKEMPESDNNNIDMSNNAGSDNSQVSYWEINKSMISEIDNKAAIPDLKKVKELGHELKTGGNNSKSIVLDIHDTWRLNKRLEEDDMLSKMDKCSDDITDMENYCRKATCDVKSLEMQIDMDLCGEDYRRLELRNVDSLKDVIKTEPVNLNQSDISFENEKCAKKYCGNVGIMEKTKIKTEFMSLHSSSFHQCDSLGQDIKLTSESTNGCWKEVIKEQPQLDDMQTDVDGNSKFQDEIENQTPRSDDICEENLTDTKQKREVDDNTAAEKVKASVEDLQNEGTNSDKNSKSKVESKLVDTKIDSSEETEPGEEIFPDADEFVMVADSVDGLRNLAQEFTEPEPIIIRKGKKEQITRPPPSKKCVVILRDRLQYLLKELQPWEAKLEQAARRARIQMRKELEDYVEPPEDKNTEWNITDEEGSEADDSAKVSANIGDDDRDEKKKIKLPSSDGKLSNTNSRCSTPVRPPDDIEEIDISQRGRLRKRRIIPNNVEDQFGAKKIKSASSKSEVSPAAFNQSIIVQSSKTQMVDYSDIVRQLKSPTVGTPIIIKTTQGGRTVLTSVLPVTSSCTNNAALGTFLKAQNIRFASHSGLLSTSVSSHAQMTKLSTNASFTSTPKEQHPTIQTLLASTTAAVAARALPNYTIINEGVQPISNVWGQQEHNDGVQHIMQISPETISTDIRMSIDAVTPEKSPTVKKANLMQKCVPSLSTTQRKIAPHTTPGEVPSVEQVRYYATNAGTLPISVVQQLIATHGAKLSHLANNQSILLIPMEKEGHTQNVLSPSTTHTPVKCENILLSPSSENNVVAKLELQTSPQTCLTTAPVTNIAGTPKSSPNMLILPKPQTAVTNPVLSLPSSLQPVQLQPGISGLPTVIMGQSHDQPLLIAGINVNKFLQIPPVTSSRYPSNETVRTLLDKRKVVDRLFVKKRVVSLDGKQSMTSQPTISIAEPVCQLAISAKPTIIIPSSQMSTSNTSRAIVVRSVMSSDPHLQSAGAKNMDRNAFTIKPQQCVITSISPSKLNTLLLQTSAAGAKSIPSLIKLPSKAMLDSAVKAVITSVHTTLPTVNIKVPLSTSLPSIVPRRNVTKTIQTMKSPIPVAPKVVTKHSSGQITSLAASNIDGTSSSQVLTISPTTANNTVPSSMAFVGQNADDTFVTDGTLKGSIPTGFLTPEGVVILKNSVASSQPHVGQTGLSVPMLGVGNQMMLVQNSAGKFQLVQQTGSMLTTPVLKSTPIDSNMTATSCVQSSHHNPLQISKPVVALDACGNPIFLPIVSSAKSAQQATLYSSSVHVNTCTTPIKLQYVSITSPSPTSFTVNSMKSPAVSGASFLLSQSTSRVLKPAVTQSSSLSPLVGGQTGPVSPLVNLQPDLLRPVGLQLASPLISPLRLNLVSAGLAVQNPLPLTHGGMSQVQGSVRSNLTQLLNMNPLLLKTATTTSVSPLPITPQIAQIQAGGIINRFQKNILNPTTQVLQFQGSRMVSPAVNPPINLLGQFVDTQSPTPKQLVFQYPQIQVSTANMSSVSATINASSSSQSYAIMALKNLVNIASTKDGVPQISTPVPNQTVLMTHLKGSLSPGTVHGSSSVASHMKQTLIGNSSVPIIKSELASEFETQTTSVTVSKATPAQQKLLLFRIGGQLVTDQGVPVSLSNGVLKIVPGGKIKVNNQTLTQEQIKQTLAKINEAASVTLNPAGQQSSTVSTLPLTAIESDNEIPIKMSLDSKDGLNLATSDHSYLSNPEKNVKCTVTTVLNGTVVADSSMHADSKTSTPQTIQYQSEITGLNFVAKSEDLSDGYHMTPSKCRKYMMKPMIYSSGYVVCPSEPSDVQVPPSVSKPSFDITKIITDTDAKGFVVKAPEKESKYVILNKHVKPEINGAGDASDVYFGNNTSTHNPTSRHLDSDDNEETKLVIDDSSNEKEAALNLLTLANQALAPHGGNTYQNMDNLMDQDHNLDIVS